MPLVKAFGQHTQVGDWVLNYLLNKVEQNIRSPLYNDTSLMEGIIGLLMSLVDIRHKYVLLLLLFVLLVFVMV